MMCASHAEVRKFVHYRLDDIFDVVPDDINVTENLIILKFMIMEFDMKILLLEGQTNCLVLGDHTNLYQVQ